MTFDAFDFWWWPYFFILIAGWLATDMFRFLGVYFGGRMAEASEALVLVRAVATALVAAVVGNLVLFPAGALAEFSEPLRAGAFAFGFVIYLVAGKNVLAGIMGGEGLLLAGYYLAGTPSS